MRYFFFIFGLSVIAVMCVLGKRGSQQLDGGGHFRKPPLYIFPDMERQLKLRQQKENGFFTNGLSSQLPVPGTVARTGAFIHCRSSWGPFDMVGNVHEWIDDPNGTFLGGYYLDINVHRDQAARFVRERREGMNEHCDFLGYKRSESDVLRPNRSRQIG